MYHNFVFDGVNDALPALLTRLDKAPEVGSRVGRTKELTHVGTTLTRPWNREILLPARKADIAAQIAETMWVLAGRDDMEFLLHYLPRAADFSDDGKTWRAGYGARLRHWKDAPGEPIDQIRWAYEHLKKDPASRRAVLSIWDPYYDTADGVKDIPCNDWLNFSSRDGYLDLHVAVRSNDIIWGWSGINQFEWSSLLEVMAGLLGLRCGALHFSTTSFHIYDRHWAKADKIVEHRPVRPGYGLEDSPRFRALDQSGYRDAFHWFEQQIIDWFAIEEGIRNGRQMDEAVEDFQEPMLQSWLRVLQWWWTGDDAYLAPLANTRLREAVQYAVQPPEREFHDLVGDNTVVKRVRVDTYKEGDSCPQCGVVMTTSGGRTPLKCIAAACNFTPSSVVRSSPFIESVIETHIEKDAAYGPSWKKRGELFSIIPNIARKVDRLGGAETSDETSADTALDLLVYLAKYRTWLDDTACKKGSAALDTTSDTPDAANDILREVDFQVWPNLQEAAPDGYQQQLEHELREDFERLASMVENREPNDGSMVDYMLTKAYRLAAYLWGQDHDEYRGADVD